MAFNIDSFLSNALPDGGARPTLFSVNISSPFGSPNDTQWQFLCRAASIPPANLDIIRVPYFGRMTKFAGDRDFPDWPVTIYNDESFPLRVLLEKWNNSINTLVSNRMDDSQATPIFYKTTGTVTQYGKQGSVLAAYNIVGLWPVSVDTMRLDWGAQNQLQEFDVTFAFDYWEPNINGTVTAGSADVYSGVLSSDGTESVATPASTQVQATAGATGTAVGG